MVISSINHSILNIPFLVDMSNCFRAWGGLQKRRAGSKYAFFWSFGLFGLLVVFHVKDGGMVWIWWNMKLMLLMTMMTVRLLFPWIALLVGIVVLYLYLLFCICLFCCFAFAKLFQVLNILGWFCCFVFCIVILSVDTLSPSLFPLLNYLLCCFVFVGFVGLYLLVFFVICLFCWFVFVRFVV